ncbi:MAG: DUF5104 domain-containing protein [Clostridiales bacterium]|nr:DUF5104 domain-containing protein [Clostridiales bacterium]
MKKNKIATACMLVLMTAVLQGCTNIKEYIPDFKKGTEESKNPVYKSAEEEIAFLVDAIERKDAQAIKDKFSPYAQDNIDNLDAKIDRLIEEFPGWNDDYEVTDTFERWSNHGKITYMLTPSFDFDVDGKTYRMRIIYYTESDEDESKLGYYSIQIYERFNYEYSSDVYMHGVDDEPDILLWDYTKD